GRHQRLLSDRISDPGDYPHGIWSPAVLMMLKYRARLPSTARIWSGLGWPDWVREPKFATRRRKLWRSPAASGHLPPRRMYLRRLSARAPMQGRARTKLLTCLYTFPQRQTSSMFAAGC